MITDNYLTNIPQQISKYGFCKTLLVRYEVIHLKHIWTEIFNRKSIDINQLLEQINWNLFDYMGYMTNRLRKIHHFNREYTYNLNAIVKHRRNNFFPTLKLYNGLDNIIVLDFDGVVTEKSFELLYNLCLERGKVFICSGNPTIEKEWFIKRGLELPHKIYSNKGKHNKLKCLLEIANKYDNVFYIDNEIKYLEFAWVFGIKTFHYKKNKIVDFTLKQRKING